jgi:hypothetical protein
MSCLASALLVLISAFFGGTVDLPYTTGGGCVTTHQACTYFADETGDLSAYGPLWHATVERHGRRIVYGSGANGSGATSLHGVIRRGDHVRAWTDDPNHVPSSIVIVGARPPTP